jgi:hypothetical protein
MRAALKGDSLLIMVSLLIRTGAAAVDSAAAVEEDSLDTVVAAVDELACGVVAVVNTIVVFSVAASLVNGAFVLVVVEAKVSSVAIAIVDVVVGVVVREKGSVVAGAMVVGRGVVKVVVGRGVVRGVAAGEAVDVVVLVVVTDLVVCDVVIASKIEDSVVIGATMVSGQLFFGFVLTTHSHGTTS